jgi:methionine-rich copper-binding protein CopC
VLKMSRVSKLLVLLLLGGVLPAWAARHLELLGSTPKKDQTVASAPIDIALIFSESVDSVRTTVSLEGPAGPVELGPVRMQDERLVVLAKVTGAVPAGTYTVAWVAAAPEEDPIRGNYKFTVRQRR